MSVFLFIGRHVQINSRHRLPISGLPSMFVLIPVENVNTNLLTHNKFMKVFVAHRNYI